MKNINNDVLNKLYTIVGGKVKVLSYNVSSLYPNKIQMSSMYGKFDGGIVWKK